MIHRASWHQLYVRISARRQTNSGRGKRCFTARYLQAGAVHSIALEVSRGWITSQPPATMFSVDLRGATVLDRPHEWKAGRENQPIVKNDVCTFGHRGVLINPGPARRDQTQFNGLVLGYRDHGPIRHAKQRQSQSPGALCTALDTQGAGEQQPGAAWRISSMDDGASEEPSSNWRAGRKEKRLDAGSLVRAAAAAAATCHDQSAPKTPAVWAHSKRHCPGTLGNIGLWEP